MKMFEIVEAGHWEACLTDITRPVLWSQVRLWPQVLCEQYSLNAKHKQTIPPDTDGNYAHNSAAILKLHSSYLQSHVKTSTNLWNKHTIYYRTGAERSAFVRGKNIKNIPELFSWIRQFILTVNLTPSYPCSHVTQLTAEEREHMILQHILHLIFIYLLLSEYE